MDFYTISLLPDPKDTDVKRLKDGKVYVSLPVYVLALRRFNFGFLLVTDFTSHKDLIFAHKPLKVYPREFVVGGRKLRQTEIFSISIHQSKIPQVWHRMDENRRLASCNMNDDVLCDVLQLGIVAYVNFVVQKYNNKFEGFFANFNLCCRRSESDERLWQDMQSAQFKAFMGRMSTFLNMELYSRILETFPIESYVEDSSVRNVRPRLNEPPERRRLGPPKIDFQTQPERSALSTRDLIFQQQESQMLGDAMSQRIENDQNAQTGNVSQNIDENFSLNEQVSHENVSNETSDLLTQNGILRTQNVFQTQNVTQFTQNQRQVVQTQFLPQESQLLALQPTRKSYSVHQLHQIPCDAFASISCAHVDKGTSFEITSKITQITPNPADIFVKPYLKTLRVAPFKIHLGEVQIELHTADEACIFFGVQEIECLIHHIHEYTLAMQGLVGQTVKMKAEKRVNCFAQGYERSYWGLASTLQSLQRSKSK